jgi:hypothetical protein
MAMELRRESFLGNAQIRQMRKADRIVDQNRALIKWYREKQWQWREKARG